MCSEREKRTANEYMEVKLECPCASQQFNACEIVQWNSSGERVLSNASIIVFFFKSAYSCFILKTTGKKHDVIIQ